MTVSSKCNATLLQFLHHIKAHILPFNVRFQHKSHFIKELFPGDCDSSMAWQGNNPIPRKSFGGFKMVSLFQVQRQLCVPQV